MGDDKVRFDALCLAMELGAEYVDVELKVGVYTIVYILQANAPKLTFIATL